MMTTSQLEEKVSELRVKKLGLDIIKSAVRQLDYLEERLKNNAGIARSQMFDTQRLIQWVVEDGKSFKDFEPTNTDTQGVQLDKVAGEILKLAQQRKRIISLLESLDPSKTYDLSLDDLGSLGLEGLSIDSPKEL